MDPGTPKKRIRIQGIQKCGFSSGSDTLIFRLFKNKVIYHTRVPLVTITKLILPSFLLLSYTTFSLSWTLRRIILCAPSSCRTSSRATPAGRSFATRVRWPSTSPSTGLTPRASCAAPRSHVFSTTADISALFTTWTLNPPRCLLPWSRSSAAYVNFENFT